ncbi:MAG: hypothetical protein KJ964_06640 [Verrucomicrobia bacterium]|nr:hypothetical protein [Verrucomicrobiota bacterium]MBU1735109.1 hypothetical protein [Verrucomicrobiota bacterium]MBU1856375.1 hypothetical protein [Verrucomicrobiota bacterium]
MWLTVLSFTLLLPIPSLLAGKVTGTQQSSRLYTKSDPAARGGIHAKLAAFTTPVQQVFAIDNGNPKLVYQGTVLEDGKEIQFAGLPVAIYDLVLVAPDRFYEGCRLARDPDTLTDRDRQSIAFTINKSVPFFDTKKIHRCEGTTGRNGKVRCVLQEVRTHPVTLQDATTRTDIQVRSIKLAFLEDVGAVGWQMVQTREIVRTEVGPKDMKGLLPHCYLPVLGGIRVVDTDKDLGELNLMNGMSASKE